LPRAGKTPHRRGTMPEFEQTTVRHRDEYMCRPRRPVLRYPARRGTGAARQPGRKSRMLTREILVTVPVPDDALARVAAVDPCLHVVDARGSFDVEIRETWPPWTVQRYLGERAGPIGSRQERDRLLAGAEIVLGGFPFPLDLRARAPRLRWFHQLPAGASNLLRGDLWGSEVLVTTSRGH